MESIALPMETQTAENREETGIIGKDSPLTDITTSPPAFDLSSEKIDLLKPPVGENDSTVASSADQPIKASYSSSELSDLGEEDSEAETDKMDFLDDDGNTSTEGVGTLDLNALSKLTELARLKEVDSDSEDDNFSTTSVSKASADGDTETAVSETADPELPSPQDHQQQDVEGDNYEEQETNNQQEELEPTPKIVVDAAEDIANGIAPDEERLSLKRTIEDSDEDIESKRPKVGSETEDPEKLPESILKHEQVADKEATPDEEVEESVKNGRVVEDDGKEHASPVDEADNESSHEETDEKEKQEDTNEAVNDVAKEDTISTAGTDLETAPRDESVEPVSESKEESHAENEDDEIEDEEEDEVGGDEADENGDKPDHTRNSSSQNHEIDINEQRKLAVNELFEIEQSFAELRDKLFQDKLTLLEHELQLCLEGSHPELSQIYYKVNEFYQDSLQLANANLTYSLKCIDKETIATRTSVHQNFLRQLMDSRNELITDTTSLWYKINKERNQYDQLVPDFTYSAIPVVPKHAVPDENSGELMPILVSEERLASGLEPNAVPLTKKAIKQNTLVELVKQRNNVNQQLGIINGLKQFYGMPVAVGSSLNDERTVLDDELLLKRATEEEINEDLVAMGISI